MGEYEAARVGKPVPTGPSVSLARMASDPQNPGDAIDPHDPDQAALDHAVDVFTAHCEGYLRIDEQGFVLKYIIDPENGRLVASAPVAVFHAAEHVLFVPEETDDALQVLLSAEEMQEGVATDRWLAYHATPDHVRWASFWIDGARHGPWVFDGEAIGFPNPLGHEEAALCKALNEDKAKLAALCQRYAGTVVPTPVCVGVDPRGIHVRARFGIVRARFEDVCATAAAAREAIEGMLGGVS